MSKSESDILAMLRRDHLVSGPDVCLTALSGGISSDVFLVASGEKRFVIKRALAQLRTKDLWRVDISRNRNEYEYLKYVGRILPEAVPAVLALGDGYFTMEYLGSEFKNWKQLLLGGHCDSRRLQQAARILGTIHRSSFGDRKAERLFDTTPNFHQLRTDPYLLTTGQRHPALREYFEQEAFRLENTRECLVHGDYSPKNLLVGSERMVLLDCEVAWYGDPAFDLAFLLNHLLLKSLYHAATDLRWDQVIGNVMGTYYRERELETDTQREFDGRTARLLLLLLLARVDGKSPVEYLSNEEKRAFIRRFVSSGLHSTTHTLQVVNKWFMCLQEQFKGDYAREELKRL